MVWPVSADWPYIAVLTLVCTVYGYSLAAGLMKQFTAFMMNLTVNLEPIYGIALAVWIFGEKEKMTQAEEQKVKLAAKSLLERLTKGKPKVLVQEWFRDTQSKQQVAPAVDEVLHEHLPESYDRVLFKAKCDEVFNLVLDHASQGRKWAA